MQKLLTAFAAFLLLIALVVQAQEPDGKGKGGPPKGKGGGGGAPKNLWLLPAAAVGTAMPSFVQGLGLADKGGCAYCHADDRSSDEKKQKLIARSMIAMVREINLRFQDGKQHVTCFTCHRGNPTPAMEP